MDLAGWGWRVLGARLRAAFVLALVALGVTAEGSSARSLTPAPAPALTWSSATTIPGAATHGFPDLVAWNGELWAFWAGTAVPNPDGIHYSAWNGSSWSTPAAVPNAKTNEDVGPNGNGAAAAVFNNQLYVAWMSSGASPNHVEYETFDGTSWSAVKSAPNTNSTLMDGEPALHAYQGKLYLFWTYDRLVNGVGHVTIRYATFDTHSWSAPVNLPQFDFELGTPGLAVFNGHLQMAFHGLQEEAAIEEASFDGAAWSPAALVSGPKNGYEGGAPATFDNHLYVAWGTLNGPNHLRLSERVGGVWTKVSAPNSEVFANPSLARFGGQLWLAWLGGGTAITYATSATP